MSNLLDTSLVFSFGGNTPECIYENISNVVGDREYVSLNINKTNSTISMFDSVVFRIRINSRTQCLDSENSIVLNYISKIQGASQTKETAHLPLTTTVESLDIIREMLQELYKHCRAQVSVESFGCCNDHVRCSDAKQCLHLNDREYWGCYYRKNLEAGRIFYGKNKNI